MLRFFASLYSCSLVRPCAPVCDRLPPRCPDETSLIDDRLAVFDSPARARSLFTVRAAISSARLVEPPRFLTLSLMCSYCRSRLGLDPAGMVASFASVVLQIPGTRADQTSRACPGAAAGHWSRDQRGARPHPAGG